MTAVVPVRCRCGCVAGSARVSPDDGLRFVCYCTDCQAFAQWLGRADALDAAGGTDIYQLPPARLTLSAGAGELRCVRRSDKVLRWYAACCKTPIGNTATTPRFPLVALIHAAMDHAATGRSRDELLGPARCALFERSATSALPRVLPAPGVALFARRGGMMLRWWLGGMARPSPFFDARSGAPVAAPAAM
jgi:hypothetical protein